MLVNEISYCKITGYGRLECIEREYEFPDGRKAESYQSKLIDE